MTRRAQRPRPGPQQVEHMKLEMLDWGTAIDDAKKGEPRLLVEFLEDETVDEVPMQIRKFLAALIAGRIAITRRAGRRRDLRAQLDTRDKKNIREVVRVNDINAPGNRAAAVKWLAKVYNRAPATIRDVLNERNEKRRRRNAGK